MRLIAEIPRVLLLSAFHTDGDVENRAAGAVRAHRDEGAKKESTASVGITVSAGRSVRNVGMAIIARLSSDGYNEGCACRQKLQRMQR